MAVRFGLLVMAALVSFPSLSSAQDVVARLKGDGLEERFTEEAAVSGRVVAGVLAGSASASDALALYASTARASDDICVRVISRDGLYWSENTFTWPDGADSGVVRRHSLARPLPLGGAPAMTLFALCRWRKHRTTVCWKSGS